MDKYIEIDGNNKIIDVFFTYQKNKMKSTTKILLEQDISEIKHKINNKSISDELGTFIFKYENDEIVERSSAEVEAETLEKYKDIIKRNLRNYIKENVVADGIVKTIDQIRTQWKNTLVPNLEAATTISEVDTIYNNAITWLTS